MMNTNNNINRAIRSKITNINCVIKASLKSREIDKVAKIDISKVKFCGEDVSKAQRGIQEAQQTCTNYLIARWMKKHSHTCSLSTGSHNTMRICSTKPK